jgi:hypothetical protein
MLEVLTGTGLATAAGLNAYIPLLTLGLLARYTDVVTLPEPWRWLENPWVLGAIAVLLSVELIADKVPVVDHVNDVVQTVVRPTAGGLTFGASTSSETVTVQDPPTLFSHHAWIPVVAGIVLALVVHSAKAAVRAVINATTLGFGAPVVSTLEDGVSLSMSLAALLVPLLVVVFLAAMVGLFWWARRRRARRRAARARLPVG